MQLELSDASYTERLASFLSSLGQSAIMAGPGQVELIEPSDDHRAETLRLELDIYLRVWKVLYPDTDVSVVG